MAAFQELRALPKPGSCIKIVCTKSVPEKLISFHRAILQKLIPQDYRVLSLDTNNLEDFFAQLSITFLGQTSVYAIKDGDLSTTDRKKFDNFLKEYSGPHTIYFFTSDPIYEKNAIALDTVINKKNFLELATLNNYVSIAPNFIEKLFTLKASYTFDETVTLMNYAHLLGARSDAFFTDWVERILTDDISLFTLSQYFFAQQKNLSYKNGHV